MSPVHVAVGEVKQLSAGRDDEQGEIVAIS